MAAKLKKTEFQAIVYVGPEEAKFTVNGKTIKPSVMTADRYPMLLDKYPDLEQYFQRGNTDTAPE